MMARIRPGSVLLEVVLAMALIGVIVVTVSNLVVSVNRIDRASANKQQAIGYAREGLEITSKIANTIFLQSSGCVNPPPGYTKCWAACPSGGLTCDGTYGINVAGRALTDAADDPDGTGILISRTITIADQGTPNVKRVTADISWTEGSQPTKHVRLETILTAWHAL